MKKDTIYLFSHPATVYVTHRPWQLPSEMLKRAEVRPWEIEDVALFMLCNPEEFTKRAMHNLAAFSWDMPEAGLATANIAERLRLLLTPDQVEQLLPKLRQLIKPFQQEG